MLDADIEKCFDRISHDALLTKLSTIPTIAKLVRGWLKAGIFENKRGCHPRSRYATRRPSFPLLANIALHGLESALVASLPTKAETLA